MTENTLDGEGSDKLTLAAPLSGEAATRRHVLPEREHGDTVRGVAIARGAWGPGRSPRA